MHTNRLGKVRTSFGKFLDDHGIKQTEFGKSAGINSTTLTELCGNVNYGPYTKTMEAAIEELRKRGYKKRIEDFW